MFTLSAVCNVLRDSLFPWYACGRPWYGPFFFVDAKRQIWLTRNYVLQKRLRFSRAVACAGSVVVEATCTSSGNKQKVRHFREDCVTTLCVELNCENCKEFADHPFVLRIEGTSSQFTRPAKRNNEFSIRTCVFIPSTYVPNAKTNKQHVDTRYSYHIHTIFTHDIHRISVFKNQGHHHGNQRHQPFVI